MSTPLIKVTPGFTRRRAGARRQRGSELVEFVILFPLTLFMVFALIEFSIAMFNYGVLIQAAREGAREGSLYWVDVTQITPDSDPAADQRISRAEVDRRIGDWTRFLINFGDAGVQTQDCIPMAGGATIVAGAGDEVRCGIQFQHATFAATLLGIDALDLAAGGVNYVE